MLNFHLEPILVFNKCKLLNINTLKNTVLYFPRLLVEFCSYKSLIIFLLKFTKLNFGKTFIRLWVNFGKNLVPGKQGVDTGRKWPENGLEMLKFKLTNVNP